MSLSSIRDVRNGAIDDADILAPLNPFIKTVSDFIVLFDSLMYLILNADILFLFINKPQ